MKVFQPSKRCNWISDGENNIFVGTENVGAVTKAAWVAGHAWLDEQLNLSQKA